jgi:DnaJ-class molecular chaperone
MKQKNYYETLGVQESASEDDIKKSFRSLAKEHHPDRNPGDAAAEARFKDINEAYEVLGDPEKRRKYDELRRYSSRGGAGGSMSYEDFLRHFGGQRSEEREFTWGFDVGNLGDIFENLFGGTTRTHRTRSRARPRDFSRARQTATAEPEATADPFFKRKGEDAYVDIDVNLAQVLLGSKIRVRTPSGRSVYVRIPAGLKPDAVLRVRGMGFGRSGDLLIRTHLSLPDSLRDEEREAVETLARLRGWKY